MAHLGVALWQVPALAVDMRRRMLARIDTVRPFPGVDAALRALAAQDVSLALVTSNTRDAARQVLGEHARKVIISSTKSMTGHLLGAAGGIEAIITAKTVETGVVPPTINYETPDPDCDLDYTPNVKRTADVKVAVSDNLGFGGQNAALIFAKV